MQAAARASPQLLVFLLDDGDLELEAPRLGPESRMGLVVCRAPLLSLAVMSSAQGKVQVEGKELLPGSRWLRPRSQAKRYRS